MELGRVYIYQVKTEKPPILSHSGRRPGIQKQNTHWTPACTEISAPRMGLCQFGASPKTVVNHTHATEGNCVTVRWGGEQSEVKRWSAG